MPHQYRADTLPLVLIDHCESYFSCPGAYDDVPSTADYCATASFSHDCDQRDVVSEIHVQKEGDFLFGKIPF
jgi:hypothetical protein